MPSAASGWRHPKAAHPGRIDLLSVMMHEIGHLRGEDHAAADADPANVMHETFGVGMRRFHLGSEGGAAENDDDTQVDVLTTLFGEPLTLTPTIVWIGGASGNWNLAANWRDANNLSRLPTASDDVFIGYDDPNTPGNDVATITVSTNVSARALLSEENVLLSSGGRLNLSADSEIAASLTGSGGILTIADTLTLTGTSQWNSGDWNIGGGLVNLGELTIATGADHWLNGTLSNRGLVVHEAGRIWLNQGTIQNLAEDVGQQLPGGVWEGRGGQIDNWSNGQFRNFGELRGAGTYSVSVALTNTGGTISGQSGTLSLNASTALQDGTVYVVAEGAVVQHNAGSHVLSGGISGTGAGRVLFNGGSVSTAAGAPATVDFAQGLAEWQSGNWSLGGGLVNVGHLRVTSGADRFLSGTLSNRGLVVHDVGRIYLNQGTIANLGADVGQSLAGGIWQGSGGLADNWSNGQFQNTGTIRITGNYAVSVNLVNMGGVLDVDAGTLTLNATGTLGDGTFYDIADAAIVQHVAGSYAFTGRITGQREGTGKLRFNGAGISTGFGGATLDFGSGVAEWVSGNWSLANGLTNDGEFTITGGADRFFTSGSFENRGHVIHQSGRLYLNSNTIFNLAADVGQGLDGGPLGGRRRQRGELERRGLQQHEPPERRRELVDHRSCRQHCGRDRCGRRYVDDQCELRDSGRHVVRCRCGWGGAVQCRQSCVRRAHHRSGRRHGVVQRRGSLDSLGRSDVRFRVRRRRLGERQLVAGQWAHQRRRTDDPRERRSLLHQRQFRKPWPRAPRERAALPQ